MNTSVRNVDLENLSSKHLKPLYQLSKVSDKKVYKTALGWFKSLLGFQIWQLGIYVFKLSLHTFESDLSETGHQHQISACSGQHLQTSPGPRCRLRSSPCCRPRYCRNVARGSVTWVSGQWHITTYNNITSTQPLIIHMFQTSYCSTLSCMSFKTYLNTH